MMDERPWEQNFAVMYKWFALAVLVLAPALSIIADNVVPKRPDAQQAAPDAAPDTDGNNMVEQPGPPAEPMTQQQSFPVDPGAPGQLAGVPMLNPNGIDPSAAAAQPIEPTPANAQAQPAAQPTLAKAPQEPPPPGVIVNMHVKGEIH